jgi:YHS domain-containing protein
MRILILALLIYLGYRVFKALIISGPVSCRPDRDEDLAVVDDIMVQDPLCEIYFPKKNGIKEVIDGERVYFCSTKCRDKYLDRIKRAS